MAAVDDILRSYRAPRAVVRAHLAHRRSEGRVFSFLIAALIVMLIGMWPELARQNYLAPEQKMPVLIMGRALALLATIPAFYALAALGPLISKLFGGRGDWYGGRLSLFWALFAVSPLMLLQGLVAGFIGDGPQLTAVSLVVFAVFLWFWLAGLTVTEFEREAP